MAETNLMQGESLPKPNPSCTDSEADLEEPIYLLLTATPRVQIVPKEKICYEAACNLEFQSLSERRVLETCQVFAPIFESEFSECENFQN
jgi:hypothetical protein